MENETLSTLITDKECYTILERHIDDGNISIIDYRLSRADTQVIGYLGDHFRMKVSYIKNEDNILRESTFFVKTVPIFNEIQEKYVTEVGVFKKESLLYENVLPKLTAIAGVYFAPRCYLIKENCLVFEDLLERNFKMRDLYVNNQECESLVICLAKFHSASVIYEELNSLNGKQMRLSDLYVDELRETAFSFIEGQPRNMWLKNNTKCISDIIRLFYKSENLEEILEKLHSFVLTDMQKYIGPSDKYRNVVTHCDLWTNNFLINDKLECVLVDFQLARYTPPAYDLLLTLFLNNTMSYLHDNLENLLDLYYDTFEKMLQLYKLEARTIFPKDSFLESVEFVKAPTLLEAVFFTTNTLLSQETSNFILSDTERFHEFSFTNRSKFAVKEFQENETFKMGVLEILNPLIELLQNMDITCGRNTRLVKSNFDEKQSNNSLC